MDDTRRPVSLIAERALRYLREHGGAASSVELARDVMATSVTDEPTARRVLVAAFAGDSRLAYADGAWREHAAAPPARAAKERETPLESDPDRTLLSLTGARIARGEPFRLDTVAALRLQGELVVGACGGDATPGRAGDPLRRAILKTLDGAVPVVHDPPGSLVALERWLGETLPPVISLRRLAHERTGLGLRHDLEALIARLGLAWREGSDLVELADALDACLQRLRRPGETLRALQLRPSRGERPIDWSRYDFDEQFLAGVPAAPGTYRFYDREDNLIYVGKSKNLARRLTSYFGRSSRPRSARLRALLEALHRIEFRVAGSDLEAMLREAEQIRRDDPSRNVQRALHRRRGRAARLLSILILEPAEPPYVLRAYCIRDARLVGRVGIGPRGGGLRRIERVLEDHFFAGPTGPTAMPGPDLDVEVVARWLAANRDRVVAFDPTDLGSTREVIERLRWFLDRGSPFDTDGSPLFHR